MLHNQDSKSKEETRHIKRRAAKEKGRQNRSAFPFASHNLEV